MKWAVFVIWFGSFVVLALAAGLQPSALGQGAGPGDPRGAKEDDFEKSKREWKKEFEKELAGMEKRQEEYAARMRTYVLLGRAAVAVLVAVVIAVFGAVVAFFRKTRAVQALQQNKTLGRPVPVWLAVLIILIMLGAGVGVLVLVFGK